MKKIISIIVISTLTIHFNAQSLQNIKDFSPIINTLFNSKNLAELDKLTTKSVPYVQLKFNNDGTIDKKQFEVLSTAIQRGGNGREILVYCCPPKVIVNRNSYLLFEFDSKEGKYIGGTKIYTNGKVSYIKWLFFYNCCKGICGNSASLCETKNPTWNPQTNQFTCGCNGHCSPASCPLSIKWTKNDLINIGAFQLDCNPPCPAGKQCNNGECQ